MTYSSGKNTILDIDAYAESPILSGTRVEQLTPGLFQSTTEHIQTGKIFLYRQHWNKGIMAQTACPDGHVLIGGNISDQTQIIWSGKEICSNNLFIAKSKNALDYIMPTGSKHIVLIVPEDIFEAHLNDNYPYPKMHSSHLLACDPQLRSKFINRVNLLISHCLLDDKALSNETKRKLIDAEALDLLSHLLVNPEIERLNTNKSRMVLKRATEYVEEITDPITVAELATVAGVSQRRLERVFRKYLNLTPVKYLIMKRLHGLHRDLRHFTPGSTTISKCSTHWGFTQFGRMSVQYRRMFGMSPSATLNQPYRQVNKHLIDNFRHGDFPN